MAGHRGNQPSVRLHALICALVIASVAESTITESESTVNGNAAVTASAAITEGDLASGEIMGTKIEVTGSANGSLVASEPSEPWDQIAPLSLKIEVLGIADGVAGPHVIWDVGPEAFTAPGPGATGPSATKSFRMSSVVFPDGEDVTIKVTAKYLVIDDDVAPANTSEVIDTSIISVPARNRATGWRSTRNALNQVDTQFTLLAYNSMRSMFVDSGYGMLTSQSLLHKEDLLSGENALLDRSTAVFGVMHGTQIRLSDHDGHPTDPSQGDRLMAMPGTDSPETISEVVADVNETLPGHCFAFLYSCNTLSSSFMPIAFGTVTTSNTMIVARSYMGFTTPVMTQVIDKARYREEVAAGRDHLEATEASLVGAENIIVWLHYYLMLGYSVSQAITIVEGEDFMDMDNGYYVAATVIGASGEEMLQPQRILFSNSDKENTLYWVYLTLAERHSMPHQRYASWFYKY